MSVAHSDIRRTDGVRSINNTDEWVTVCIDNNIIGKQLKSDNELRPRGRRIFVYRFTNFKGRN